MVTLRENQEKNDLTYQDFRGVPAVQPIRPKEPGTKMEKV